MGLVGQLTVEGVLVLVLLARRMRTVEEVVFMGVGEPAHNL